MRGSGRGRRLEEAAAPQPLSPPRLRPLPISLPTFSRDDAQAVRRSCSWPPTAFALAELLSRRGLERPCETLVAWTRDAEDRSV
jgi:hypothetical protein